MKKTLTTHLGHVFYQLDYVQFVMQQILDGLKIDDVRKKFVEENPFGIKSESSRKTYMEWIKRDYIKGFKPKELMIFSKVIADKEIHPQIKREILFWKNCLSDELARSITVDFILGRYQNTKFFKRKELYEFISERVTLNPVTVNRCVTGYLFLAKKVGIFSLKSNIYEFKFYRPQIESVIFLLFYLLNSKRTPSQIIMSEDFKYLLITENELIQILKEIQSKGLISFAMSGDVVRLDPKIEFEEIPDAIRS